MKSHLPRNGRYELFTYLGKTHCFDDPDFRAIPTPKDLFDWIKQQNKASWSGLDDGSDVAYYLDPELYMIFKIKWS